VSRGSIGYRDVVHAEVDGGRFDGRRRLPFTHPSCLPPP